MWNEAWLEFMNVLWFIYHPFNNVRSVFGFLVIIVLDWWSLLTLYKLLIHPRVSGSIFHSCRLTKDIKVKLWNLTIQMCSKQLGLSNVHTFKIAIFNSRLPFFICLQTGCNPFPKLETRILSFFFTAHSPGIHV